jgi:AAA+ ATPase superfamily predicted ATPase
MNTRRLFPLGKAYGQAFCNRTPETKKLISNIESGKHTYLVAPRRYGKSSLCENAFVHSALAHETVDFHLAVTEKDAEQLIVKSVINLIGKAIGAIDKFQHIIKKYVKNLKPKATLGPDFMKLELAFDADSNPAENIAEALFLLEKLLQERNKQAILLFDEFQEIGRMEASRGIEGAIRHVAQETQNLALIFSGSNPRMLESMFEDERRPLYKLCRKVSLDRISEIHYKDHLNKAAKERWKRVLPAETFTTIMNLTERHPYYVNYLCDEVWLENEKVPKVQNVEEAWDLIVEEERSDLLKDFFSLAENQKKILIYIANYGGENMYAHDVVEKTAIPSGSLPKTLTALVEKNYLEKQGAQYRIITPVYRKLLSTKIRG